MQTLKIIGGAILFILLFTALAWLIQGSDFFLYKFWAPKYEGVRREVFENTKSYNQGMIQEIRNYQIEYVKATKEQKGALASVILHQVADYPEDKMPLDVKDFIQSLRNKQGVM